jgi:hypothetical protein
MKYPTVTVQGAYADDFEWSINSIESLPDGVYELHPVGGANCCEVGSPARGVFIPWEKCEECVGTGSTEVMAPFIACGACGGKGYTWPEHIKGMVSGALFRLWEGNNGRRIDQQKLGASSVVILDALVEAAKDTP